MIDYIAIRERYDALVDSSEMSELSEKVEFNAKLLDGELQQRLDAVVERGYKFVKAENAQLREITQLWSEKASQVVSITRDGVPELEQQIQQLKKRAESVLKQAHAQASAEAEEEAEQEDSTSSSARRLSMSRDDDDEKEEEKPASARRLSMSRDDDEEEKPASRRLSMSREDNDEKAASSARRLSLSGEKDDDDGGKSSKLDAELAQLDGMIEKLQEKADHIRRQLSDVEREVSDQIAVLTGRLSRIEWMLGQFEEAGFELPADESIYLVDKAEWFEEGKRESPDGVMYLTNSRVIFEQKEKVGKRLGMFGGKKVQDVLWEFPVTAVDDVQIENKGMFGGKDVVHFRLNDQSHYADLSVVVQGSGDNKEWAEAVHKVKSGELD